MHPRARELVDLLRLTAHPEGGFFREIFRSARTVDPRDGRPRRSALTTIFFLLVEGQVSRWHAVDSDEVWHLYEGGPLELNVAPVDVSTCERIVLSAASTEHLPSHTVPAGWWQAARPLAPFALAGCTVGPGFEFEDFRLMAGDAAAAARLRESTPGLATLL